MNPASASRLWINEQNKGKPWDATDAWVLVSGGSSRAGGGEEPHTMFLQASRQSSISGRDVSDEFVTKK